MEPCQSRVPVMDAQLSLHCNERGDQSKCSPEFREDISDWGKSYETKPCEISSDLTKESSFDISDENIDSHDTACFMVKEDINLNPEELEMESASSFTIKKRSGEEPNASLQDNFVHDFMSYLSKIENEERKLAFEEPFQAAEKILLESGHDFLMDENYVASLLAGANSSLATTDFDEDAIINWTFEDSIDECDFISNIEHKDNESTVVEKSANKYSDQFRGGSTSPFIRTLTSKTFEGESYDSYVKGQENLDHKNLTTITCKDQKLAFGESFKRADRGCRVKEIDFVVDESDIIPPFVAKNINSNKGYDDGEMMKQFHSNETCTDNVVVGNDQANIGKIDEDSAEVIDTAAEREGVCYATKDCSFEGHFTTKEQMEMMEKADKCKIRKDELNAACLVSEDFGRVDFRKSDINYDLRFCVEQNAVYPRIVNNNTCIGGVATEYLQTLGAQPGIIHHQVLSGNEMVGPPKSETGHLSKQFGARNKGAVRSKAEEVRKVAFIKPTLQALSKPSSEFDFIELLLSTDNMFETKPQNKKGNKVNRKASSGIDRPIFPPKKSAGIKEDSAIKAMSAGHVADMSWHHLNRSSMENQCIDQFTSDLEACDDLDFDPNFTNINWIEFNGTNVGRLFVTGTDYCDSKSQTLSQPPLDVMSIDELILLDGLESAVIAIPATVESVVADGFIRLFPVSCNISLLVNKVHHQYPEYIIACRLCSMMIAYEAYEAGATRFCPECRIVHLATFSDQKQRCQFMLLRSQNVLRFVLLSSSQPLRSSAKQKQYGWYYDFPICKEINRFASETYASFPPIWRDLRDFLAALHMSCLNILCDVDFSNISPVVRLIFTKPGSSCVNNRAEAGIQKLKKLTKVINWKSAFPVQTLYKTERLDLKCFSVLNSLFQRSLADADDDDDDVTVKENVKIVYPSIRWVKRYCDVSGSTERLSLMSTIDCSELNTLPTNIMFDLSETEDLVQNYNVLVECEDRADDEGRIRKYGWFLTGSQSLDIDSWGEEYSAYRRTVYKHFTLGVGFFPYPHRNALSGEMEINAVDLGNLSLPFDRSRLVRYGHADMPYLMTHNRHELFAHCIGVFQKSKTSFGFVHESKALKGILDSFPTMARSSRNQGIFLHMSSFPDSELPPDGSIVEFFCLTQPAKGCRDCVKVCSVFQSIEEARTELLGMPDVDERQWTLAILRAKAEELGISWIEYRDQMEERIEDYYQEKCAWTMKDLEQLFETLPNEGSNRISMEPVSIPSDEAWLRDFYSKDHHISAVNGTPVVMSPDEFACALENFKAIKYRFVKGLEELEIFNRQ